MMIRAKAVALAIALFAALPQQGFARIIDNPQPQEIDVIYKVLSGASFDFEAEARKSRIYMQANEFDKPAALQQAVEELRRQYQGAKDVTAVKMRLRGSFSQYDAQRGVYSFDVFRPGVLLTLHRRNFVIENADAFRDWALPVEDAKAVRQRNPSGSVVYEIDLRPFAVSDTQSNTMRSQVIGLKVFTPEGQLLHEASLAPSEYRDLIRSGDTADQHPLTAEILTLQGLNLGASRSYFEQWAEENSYQTKDMLGHTRIATGADAIDFTFNLSDYSSSIISGSRNVDKPEFNIFGPKLDCRASSGRLESCGLVYFGQDKNVQSVMIMQSAVGVQQQQIVDSLTERYGPPADRLQTVLLDHFRAEQLVWGISTDGLSGKAYPMTQLSKKRHWQVEAAITKIDAQRLVVFVQLNRIEAAGGAVAGTNGNKPRF